MSPAAKRVVGDWLERVDAGLVEPEDLGLGVSAVEALREEVEDGASGWAFLTRGEGVWWAENGNDRLGPFPSEEAAREYVALPEEEKY